MTGSMLILILFFFIGLRESLGQDSIPEYESGGAQQSTSGATELAQSTEDSMGGDGDFKARGQPRIPGLEGIEFETGM
jgi:hypothetical protein